MAPLYPSWIEIPVADLARARGFYRAVFQLGDTPLYGQPEAQIAVLLPSDKATRAPGVSLVQAPAHTPSAAGVLVNFHVGDHAALAAAARAVEQHGGRVISGPVDVGDGQRYLSAQDSEGNTFALSSYE